MLDRPAQPSEPLPRLIAAAAEPLPDIDEEAFGRMFDLREGAREAARRGLLEPRLERFIGVIYRPDTERWSHYVECRLPRQFDAWVWFDQTTAVTPLPARQTAGPDDAWPFGL